MLVKRFGRNQRLGDFCEGEGKSLASFCKLKFCCYTSDFLSWCEINAAISIIVGSQIFCNVFWE